MAGIRYRLFDQHGEDPELIFGLFESVYGDSAAIHRRWAWEFLHHPQKGDVKIYVAESPGKIIGMTVRMPCTLMVGGHFKRAYFATNSMVIPEFRGQGIIRGLYDLASRDGDVQLSKGTAPGMYAVLQKIGYREIVPNTYQVCILSPLKWALNKIFGKVCIRTRETFSDMCHGEFFRLDKFSNDHDVFIQTTCSGFWGGVVKDIRTLNWRYFDIPHRRYHVFVRKCGNEVVSMVVLRLEGLTAYLVDIRWNARTDDEPASSAQFAKNFARKMGAVRLVFWGTLASLRDEMGKKLFIERSDSPGFSFYSVEDEFNNVNWASMHFVHGDGDAEYL